MFYPKTLNDPITTKISLTSVTSHNNSHKEYEREPSSPPNGRPKLVRKKSGEIVKSALKHYADVTSAPISPKAVSFTSNLVRVRSFDKLECPQSVSGIIPMTMRVINFSSNLPYLETLPVCLESIELDKENASIIGLVRVHNICFAKEVLIRYSFDHWTSFHIIYAKYLRSVSLSCMPQDVFKFELVLPPHMRVSNDPDDIYSVKFAIQYKVTDREFWDNNQGRNYSLEITPNIEVDPDYMDMSVPIPLPKGKRSSSFDLSSGYGCSPDISSPDRFKLSESKSQFGDRYNLKNSLADFNITNNNPHPNKVDSNKNSTSNWMLYDPPSPENENQDYTNNSFHAGATPYFYELQNKTKSFFDSIPIEDRSNNSSPLHSQS